MQLHRITPIFLLLISMFSPRSAFSQCGGMADPEFGMNGLAVTSVGLSDNEARAVAVQADGKIVAGGISTYGIHTVFTLLRYKTNGSLDSTFNNDGIVTINVGISHSDIRAIVIQPDGKIVAAGYCMVPQPTFAIARFNTNGTLDLTFDTDGIAYSPIPYIYMHDLVMAIQPDGKLLVATSYANNPDWNSILVRYNTDGSLDNTFDNDGYLLTQFPDLYIFVVAITLQPDGKIVLGTEVAGSNVLIRYYPDGTIDNRFGSGGLAFIEQTNTIGDLTAIGYQTGGRIVIAAEAYSGVKHGIALLCVNDEGSLDNSFGNEGIVTTLWENDQVMTKALIVQPDHKILVAGYATHNARPAFLVACFEPNGAPDTSFDDDGVVATSAGWSDGMCNAIALAPDGDIAVAGKIAYNNNSDFAVLKYKNCFETREFEGLFIYPNPFSVSATLMTENNMDNATLVIYNGLGEQVLQMNGIYGQRITLNREKLNKGAYYLQLTQGDERIAVGKLIVAD